MINIGSFKVGNCSRLDRHNDFDVNKLVDLESRKVGDNKSANNSRKLEKECQSCDVNNNESAIIRTEAINCDSISGSSSHETEDWQLLEIDEQFKTEHRETNTMDKLDKISTTNVLSDSTNYADAFGGPKSDYLRESSAKFGSKIDKKYLDIDPLSDSFSSLLVYLCTATYAMLPVASTIAMFSLIYLLFTKFYFITMIYIAYIVWDRNTCNRGGRRLDLVYHSKFWSYLAAYFPIKLRHSSEFKLNPSENYILNYHPHGISAFGAVTAFATNGLNFSKLFPGITARFMVHETSFVVPVMKETFASRGDCSVNSKSIDYMLSKKSKGNLLTIVVGGLAEADMSESEVLKTVIVERKGFVKKALIHGANLIPCIAFGENSVFHKVNLSPNSLLHRLETRWYNLFKFKHPIYFGKGVFFQKAKGLMPFKRPITVVMGDPIDVKRIANPTQNDIDKLHATYLDRLKSIYEANDDLRNKYDKRLELY